MIYLCRAKYNEPSYSNEGFRNDDKPIELIRLVQADTDVEAVKKLADKERLAIWYDGIHGGEHHTKVYDIEVTGMIV